MLRIVEKNCCGCGACVAVCPKNCIEMIPNKYGFVYPNVDLERCVSCGQCVHVCGWRQEQTSEKAVDFQRRVYAAYSLDEKTRFAASSGGLFGTLAAKILKDGGVVYGAAFDDDLKLATRRVERLGDLPKLFKSKYLQSDCSDAYSQIEDDLKSDRRVLVCSTPCQIAAIKSYLKRDYPSLIAVDFFCHGVPSQNFFDACKSYVERKKKIKIIGYEFRTKVRGGATSHYYTLTYRKGNRTRKRTSLYLSSPFYATFQNKYISLRDSCYACKYSKENRASDITLADFHGIERYLSGINRFDGVSTVVVHSAKGLTLFDAIKETIFIKEFDLGALMRNGDCFSGPTPMPARRAEFWRDYITLDFDLFAKKYMNPKKEWPKFVYYSLPTGLRKLLKRIILKEM